MDTDPRFDMLKAACPTRQVIDRIADKWTLLAVVALEASGTLRFSELKRSIEGISQKMLTQTLRTLERDGMVRREVEATVPVTVRYSLTPLGLSLAHAVGALREWSYANMDAIEAARDDYVAPTGPPTPTAVPAA
jgi:DNA-binding HxlR family transcriptional regulator